MFPEDDVLFMPEEEIDHDISGQKAQYTKKKDTTDMNTFVRFCCTISERPSIEDILEHELDNIL